MSSGPQWAAEQDESDRIEDFSASIRTNLNKLNAMSNYALVSKFDSLRSNLKTLEQVRLSRVEAGAFNSIEKFLLELGV